MICYNDANAVANESAAARYTNHEPPTLCDCGSIAEHGQVYCPVCLDVIDFEMNRAITSLVRLGFTEDQAEQAACHWLENTEEFKERRNAKEL